MSDFELTQQEADELIALDKRCLDNQHLNYPDVGGVISVPLVSVDGRENFSLDLRRGRIDLLTGTYQNRGRQAVVLVRLDFGAAPHRNPDGQEVASPHLHVYREGFGDKWATPLPASLFPRPDDPFGTLDDFMRYCNVVEPPIIQRGLFT